MKLTTALFLTALLGWGAAGARAEDIAAGGRHFAVCTSCHGDRAQGDSGQGAPRLNHLSPVYIEAQLQKFRSGQRGGEGAPPAARSMAAMAMTLPDEQALIDVSAYIATLDSPVSPPTVNGDAALGGDYYQQLCGACHAAGGAGNRALHSPRLAGSDDWYLEGQLSAFRDGVRGTHPDDRTGRQMRAMAAALPDEEAVRDVVAYLRSLAE